MAIGAKLNKLAKCGCGMLGEMERLDNGITTNMSNEGRLSTIHPDQGKADHTLAVWWCDSHHQSEWMCLDTGLGRHHS